MTPMGPGPLRMRVNRRGCGIIVVQSQDTYRRRRCLQLCAAAKEGGEHGARPILLLHFVGFIVDSTKFQNGDGEPLCVF